VGVEGDAVDDGCDQSRVGEDGPPLGEGQVGGDRDGGPFLACGDDLEEQLGASGVELGYLALPAEAAAAIFQVVSQRYLKTSIVLTSNRGVGAWGEILGDTTVAAAMLDRVLHRSVVLNLDGDSYRLRAHHAANDTLRRTTTGTRQPLT